MWPFAEGALFKSRDHFESGREDAPGPAWAGAVASLTHAQILADPQRLSFSRVRPLAEKLSEWKQRGFEKIERVDFTPDLAQEIGSARWFRGLGTLFGLAVLALAFWPDFSALEAAPAMEINRDARDEFRSQMILPLALGADSGRHMGATSAVIPLKSAPERPTVELVATLAKGDSFGRMLRRAGLGSDEAARVTALVGQTVDIGDIEPGTRVDIVLGRRPQPGAARPLDALSFRARFDLELALERRDGRLVADPRAIRTDATPLRIRGSVGSSLYRSARAAGAPAGAVQQYLRALGDQIDLDRDIGASDTFDMIIAYRRAETGETEVGDLLYAGIDRGGTPKTQLLRWGREGRFFEASGVGEVRSGLLAPVNGRVSSRYGMRRHPILGYRRMHKGLDFKAGYGAPIYAATDGVVQYAGRHGGHGNYVKIAHGGGLATGYAHMSRIAVSSGSRVRRGQVIGYVGSTGLSTGPHLHYEMYRNGATVDPSSVRFTTRAQLTGQELASFRARLADLKQVEPGAALAALAPKSVEPAEPVREIDRVNKPRELR